MLPYVKAIFLMLNNKLKTVYNLPVTLQHLGMNESAKTPMKINTSTHSC